MAKRFWWLFLLILTLALALSGCDLNNWGITQTTDLTDYGSFPGVESRHTERLAREDFERIFPEKIEPSFEQVQYYYRADRLCSWYEIVLEFTISDPADFEGYLSTLPPQKEFHPCPYLPSYLEYMPEKNGLWLAKVDADYIDDGEGTEYFRIDGANIQKILIDPEAQHVVIASLWIQDDGGTKTTSIYFFSHFHIDPQEVEQIENNNSLWATSDDYVGT